MDLAKNNFYLLKASLDDDKMTLSEKAGELEFELGEEIAQKCLADLINPKRRLYSEIRWFLDEPEWVLAKNITALDNGKKIATISTYLSAINIIDDWYDFKCKDVSELIRWVNAYYKSTKEITDEKVLASINYHRKKAGFPEANFSDVSAELNSYLSEVENKVLDSIFAIEKTNQSQFFMSFATKISSSGRPYPTWGFPQALLARYELLYSDEIIELEHNVSEFITNAKKNFSEGKIYWTITQIEEELENWANIANPVSYIDYTNGVHRRSGMSMLCDVRDFVLFLNNEKHDYSSSLKLNNILLKYCDYFPELKQDLKKGSEVIAKNLATNNELIQQQRKIETEFKTKQKINEILYDIFGPLVPFLWWGFIIVLIIVIGSIMEIFGL